MQVARSTLYACLSLYVSILTLQVAYPTLLYAQRPPAIAEYIIGFHEENLKLLITEDRTALEEALKPIVRSKRARHLATGTLGRFKRKTTSLVAPGTQFHLSLIAAKVLRPREIPNSDNLQYLQAVGLVRYIDPNIRLHTFALPNDEQIASLWGLNNTGESILSTEDIDINAPQGWAITSSSGSAVVAILDTGFDPSTPDLAGNVWRNSGEVPGNGIDDDKNGYVDDIHGCDFIAYQTGTGSSCGEKAFHNNDHGTHVAGTVGARGNNRIGIAGVAWQTQLISLAFLDDQGSGSLDDMIEGLQYAAELKQQYDRSGGTRGANIRVVNASFGHDGGMLQSEYDAIKALGDNDILFVAAAGNGGRDGLGDNNDQVPTYPASYDLPNLISVAAVNKRGQLSSFSNFGKRGVHIAAPGEAIVSTALAGRYLSLSGTSMAAPHVAGAAALLFGQRPDLKSWIAKEMLIASSKDGASVPALDRLGSKLQSGGMLDLQQALLLADTDIDEPIILKQPLSQQGANGSRITLQVQTTGAAPLRYQWQKDGKDLSGERSDSLIVTVESHPAKYRCIVSNPFGSVKSKQAEVSEQKAQEGDLNGDAVVDFKDIIVVLNNLGKRGKRVEGDLNRDGVVDLLDLGIILRYIQ